MKLYSENQMRNIDSFAINQLKIPSISLMENAGKNSADIILKAYNVKDKNVLIICGKGNNAGDGFIIARYLSYAGGKVTILLTVGRAFSKEAEKAFSFLPDDVNILESIDKISDFDIYIDCVFGTGFKGRLPDNIRKIFSEVNLSDGFKVSIDNPSGLTKDNTEDVFKADLTIDIQLLKTHQFIYPMAEYCGEVVRCDIGIPDEAVETEESNISLIDREYFKNTIKTRNKNSHKGSYGTVCSFCGSRHMPGAAVLAGKSVLKCGSGLLKTFSPFSIHDIVSSNLLESVNFNLPEDREGTIDISLCKMAIKEEIGSSDCILIGCGLSKTDNALKLLNIIFKYSKCPVVIDADGINLLSENINLLDECSTKVVLTPHPGEMARLLNVSVSDIQNNRLDAVLNFTSKYKNVVLVLKGAGTIISDGKKININNTGNPGMAKGGSGDILAGMTASFIAQKYSLFDACSMAVYIHGLCGDFAAEEKTQYAMQPIDIIEKIPEVFKYLCN